MKFGTAYTDIASEPTASNGFLKYFKDGDTTFRVLQEPEEWIGYWEHFNPNGYSFPCTQDRKTCPGCTSDNEKMKRASRKIAIHVLEGEYVNVYKVPKTVADKLSNRAERNGTITDRDYTITRYKSRNADGSTKVDYDIEGQEKIAVNIAELRPKFKDVEAMLTQSFNEAWGDSAKAQATRDNASNSQAESDLKAKLAAQRAQDEQPFEDKAASEPPPFNQPEAQQDASAEGVAGDENYDYTEDDLRKLDHSGILAVCEKEGLQVPEDVQQLDVNGIVDWLLEQE